MSTGVIWQPTNLLTKAGSEEAQRTGAMIAYRPSKQDIDRLVLNDPKAEKSDQLHCTDQFLGEAAQFSDMQQKTLTSVLMDLAESSAPIRANVFSVNMFNPGGDNPCIVLGVGGRDLDAMHKRIAMGMVEAGVYPPQDSHAPWVPHITLIYSADPSIVESIAKSDRLGPITFDAIRVAFAGNVVDLMFDEYLSSVSSLEKRIFNFCSTKVRHVRTASGVRTYDQPIGSVITTDPVSTVRRAATVADVGVRTTGPSAHAGMKRATPEDRANFKKVVGKPIPPAWTDVHIAEDLHNAKVLARGKDVKGRGQTIYSAIHVEGQAAVKFERNKQLVEHLDKLDSALERDALTDDSAAALLLIRRLGMRPGSDRDTGADKAAHGATNLRAKHAKVTPGGQTNFDFIGKKGVHIQLKVKDPFIAKIISKRLESKRGNDPLFDTDEVKTRAYMRSTGVPPTFLLKDLRTLHANVVALRTIEEFAKLGWDKPENKTQFNKWRREVAQAVSHELGNTPALALSSYINPSVFSDWVMDESWL